MDLDTVACDLCGSADARLVYRVKDNNYGVPGEFSIVQCRVCALVYLNPRPADLLAVYPGDRYYPYRAGFSPADLLPRPAHWQRARLLTRPAGPGRVLDIGCGNGLFLSAMQQLGWTCMGVEPDGQTAAFVRAHLGLNVLQGDVFVVEQSTAFDLVTLWDVLEHTPSPKSVLRRAHALLAPGGRLALSLPNWDSLERRIFGARWAALEAPRHLYHFSPDTCARLLRQCGFEIERLAASAPVVNLASNALRLGGDFLFRGGRSKASLGAAACSPPSAARLRVIRAVHLLLTLPNAAANLLQKGASLTVVARRVAGP